MEENQNTERAEEATTPVDVTPDETLASPPIDLSLIHISEPTRPY